MLLDLETNTSLAWPFEGRTLIIDGDQWVRHVVAKQIECGGGICHAAENAETALRTCERDSGIKIIVIDHDLPGADVPELVQRLRDVLPAARLVGTGAYDRVGEFERVGVTHYLVKPWTVSDLVNVLLGRLGKCVTCGLLLPLRHPRTGETPVNWKCTQCGSRYLAVLDEDLSGEIDRNVQRA
jgi:CheY-like chemotaxis protein